MSNFSMNKKLPFKTDKKVLVIGDSCVDVFVYGKASRLAPDVPVPVMVESHRTENFGMARNLVKNIETLCNNCDIVTNEDGMTVTKTRFVDNDSNHTFLRVDSHDKVKPINKEVLNSLTNDGLLSNYDLIAISDYDKGFLTAHDIDRICYHHTNVFLDSKKPIGIWAENAKYIKINYPEYKNSLPLMTEPLLAKTIITKGKNGASFGGVDYPSINVSDVRDVSGAGDSFFAALICEYLHSNSIEKAIKFANFCAAGVVQKRGVTCILQ